MRCAKARGNNFLLIVTTTDKTQADKHRYVITSAGVPCTTTCKVTLFYTGIFALKKRGWGNPVYIWTALVC